MFDQICNEQIREELEKGLIIPDEQNKRMRLLSKSWSIRPMSYKQFSNLVSKQNNFYKALVKKNGEADPLQKTLLIIDEAHKLYGGGDLSTLERPDMNAFKRAVEQSYQLSGENSVRLLLMTATPITENPMELIKIINLCKPREQQMPEIFDDFSSEYLDNYGRFTEEGEVKYLDKIAGHISYLNRERDARQFSQPIVKFVTSSLIKDSNMDMLKKYDKQYVRQYFTSDVNNLKEQITENLQKLEGDLGDLDMSKFDALKDVCDEYEGKMNKKCNKVANINIRNLLKEAKEEVKKVRDTIKSIREEIKNKNLFKKEALGEIKENVVENVEDYKKFKETMYYNLKQKCGKVVKNSDDLKEAIKEHPIMIGLNHEIGEYDQKIEDLNQQLKTDLMVYKKRILQIKELMKTELTQLEKNVLRAVLRDERKTQRKNAKILEKERDEKINEINKTKKNIDKKKKKKQEKIRKTLKVILKDELAIERQTKTAEKKLKKTLRKEGKLRENIQNEMLQELFMKYSKIINDELLSLKDVMESENMQNQMKQQAKEEKRLEKVALKEKERFEKAALKEKERFEKAALKEKERFEKKKTKEAIKIALRETKRAEKLANKKPKNKTKKSPPMI
jgi:hypothetical protein